MPQLSETHLAIHCGVMHESQATFILALRDIALAIFSCLCESGFDAQAMAAYDIDLAELSISALPSFLDVTLAYQGELI